MFYAIGNVGDSKKSDDTRVNNANDPKEHVIEITDADKPLCGFQTGKENNAICPVDEWTTGNTAYDILHSTEYVYDEEGEFESFGGKTFEFRYEMEDITEEQREVNINAWRDLYKFIVTSTDEEFYAHLKDYFVVDSALYYYLFTERYTMVDNRAKNSFWHYGKVYISNEEAIELGETEASYYIIDDEAAAINDGYRYDLTFGYDFDTCLGIDNTGDYVFSYGKEDTDYYVDGDPSSDYVFRVADSTFFCRLRDLFPTEMQAMFKDREEKGAWNSNSLITQWDNSQAKFPEELWRLDYERKYYRTYLGLSIDNSIAKGVDKTFLIGKFFGRKKYARRAFEINQEMYFATKYFGNKALSDVFWIRGNVPIGSSILPNYSLTLVPYSDMYVCVQYTSTGTPIHKKVKAGETCIFESDADRMDFIYVYAASFIQEVGDLSRCYVGDNNFSSAIRLQKLTIGSTDDGYENTFMKEVLVENNPLLEYLDLRNISGINTVIDVSGCSNLKELYAEGTNATGVIFANGGLLETAHLPSIASLSMKNLNYIKDFVIDSYANLHTLIVENTPKINTYSIVNESPLLKLVRLINLNWDSTHQITNGAIFDRLLTLDGIDSSGYETDLAVLTGNAHITIMKQQQLADYTEAWSDLKITYNTFVEQFTVTFVNDDGTVLETQYVVNGEDAIDPTTRSENPLIPTKESDVKYDYTFAGWDNVLTNVFSDRTIKATYNSSIRSYTIKYVSEGTVLQTSLGEYGTIVNYTGSVPTYTSEEAAPSYTYYLFSHWDKSGYVDGDKTIEAQFSRCQYTDKYFDEKDLSNMSPVEIYALTKLSKLPNAPVDVSDVIEDLDEYEFTIGHDFDYEDIESEVIVNEDAPMSFDGTNYYDTGIQLFNEDKDFVLAVDYEFLAGNDDGKTLIECISAFNEGFRLSYGTITVSGSNTTKVKLDVGETNSTSITDLNKREMLVIRHKQGELKLHVYNSKLDDLEIDYTELNTGTDTPFICNSTLVFGAHKVSNINYNYKAIGNINWCKVWYKDLGDAVCKELATWFHEKVKFNACNCGCSVGRHYISNTDRQDVTSLTLVASHLLTRNKSINNTNSNAGGWASANLNEYLNTRLYNALPVQIKALVKQVEITTTVGEKSSNTSSSDCYITIPSIVDVNNDYNQPPYSAEKALSDPATISFMKDENSRKRAYPDGIYGNYWLRSPSVEGSTTYYMWYVNDAGATSGFGTPNTKNGVLIEISF